MYTQQRLQRHRAVLPRPHPHHHQRHQPSSDATDGRVRCEACHGAPDTCPKAQQCSPSLGRTLSRTRCSPCPTPHSQHWPPVLCGPAPLQPRRESELVCGPHVCGHILLPVGAACRGAAQAHLHHVLPHVGTQHLADGTDVLEGGEQPATTTSSSSSAVGTRWQSAQSVSVPCRCVGAVLHAGPPLSDMQAVLCDCPASPALPCPAMPWHHESPLTCRPAAHPCQSSWPAPQQPAQTPGAHTNPAKHTHQSKVCVSATCVDAQTVLVVCCELQGTLEAMTCAQQTPRKG